MCDVIKCLCALSLSLSLALGLCIRSEEITLLVGSHGPTMNVYIAKMTVPAPCTATIPIVPWPATTNRTKNKAKHEHPDAADEAEWK